MKTVQSHIWSDICHECIESEVISFFFLIYGKVFTQHWTFLVTCCVLQLEEKLKCVSAPPATGPDGLVSCDVVRVWTMKIEGARTFYFNYLLSLLSRTQWVFTCSVWRHVLGVVRWGKTPLCGWSLLCKTNGRHKRAFIRSTNILPWQKGSLGIKGQRSRCTSPHPPNPTLLGPSIHPPSPPLPPPRASKHTRHRKRVMRCLMRQKPCP